MLISTLMKKFLGKLFVGTVVHVLHLALHTLALNNEKCTTFATIGKMEELLQHLSDFAEKLTTFRAHTFSPLL